MSQPQMNMGGPVGGGMAVPQQMNNAGTPGSGGGAPPIDAVKRLNTAIYDYLLRINQYDVARALLEIETDMKKSPSQRPGQQANGANDDSMDIDDAIKNRPEDLPAPIVFSEGGNFLQDWWCQFWETFQGLRNRGKPGTLAYIGAQRQAQKQRMGMMNNNNMDQATMQNMRGYNGMMMGNDLKRAAMQKNMYVAVLITCCLVSC
jgi:hypothetical protein